MSETESPIGRKEYEEFRLRIEERHKRHDHRIEDLEQDVKSLKALNTSIEKLALNMENMLKEQKKQGERLENLEARDGEMWRRVVSYIITAVIGVLVGFIFQQIGI